MMSSKPFLLLSILLSARISIADFYFDTHTIVFPLKNIYQSINMESFQATECNITVGKCEHVSDRTLVLNLQNLNMTLPPNPYPGFIDSRLVTCINLASNEIYQVVPGSFDLVPGLTYLDLSKNRIQLCDFFNFGSSHTNLKTLVIEENKPPIDNIDRTISKANCFTELRYLYLRKNSLRNLNFSLRKAFPSLTHLFLSDNNIDTPNFIHDLPPTLTHLYLERNLISSLDCKVMRNVQKLHLDENIIRSICFRNCQDTSLRLQGVHKLSTLTITQNKIMDIEVCAFQDSLGLMNLNLAQNNLENIKRDTFEKLILLRQLKLDNNYLSTIPNLCKNIKLVSLSIRENKLQIIKRQHFKNLRMLKSLLLGNNQIKTIEVGSFEDLESLEELDLSNNELDFIPNDSFKWQMNLRTLDVSGNRFKCLEQLSLTAAPFLSTINLRNNPVTHISGSIVSKLSQNIVIYSQNKYTDKIRNKTDCYGNCNSYEFKSVNESYTRWINNL